MFYALAWLLVGSLLSVDVSAAPGPSRKVLRAARREISRGERAIKKKKYRLALKHYTRAEELVPDLKNKISIAILYHKLDRCSESSYAWLDVIASCSEGCPYQERVQRAYQEMTKTCTAPLKVTSTPPASVIVDDRYLGMSPLEPRLLFGTHKLELKADGYRVVERRVNIEPIRAGGQALSLDVTLEPLFEQPKATLTPSEVLEVDAPSDARPVDLQRLTRIVSFTLGGAIGAFALISHGRAPPYQQGFLSLPSKGNQFLLIGSGLFFVTGVVTFF